jgi:type II secretory pathway component PulM
VNIPDYVKENLYLPYFRRMGSRARSQQILLGAGIALLALGAFVALLLWRRHGAKAAQAQE